MHMQIYVGNGHWYLYKTATGGKSYIEYIYLYLYLYDIDTVYHVLF